MNYGQANQIMKQIKHNEQTLGGQAYNPNTPELCGSERLIPHSIDHLDKQLCQLSELLNELNNRLIPVCIPEEPAKETKLGRAESDVPMVNALNMAADRVQDNYISVRKILERLEI